MRNLLIDKDYNQSLRSQILICSLCVEEAASAVLRNLLRLVKPSSKTLDNKSSSLSFKKKIDLLYDIDDLEKEDYVALVKFMEIRNQFIHNPNCDCFIDLNKEAAELSKFLSTNFKNEIVDVEKSLNESFGQLFIRALGKLLILNLEYRKGFTNEMYRYVDAQAIQNFDSIFNSAYSHWKTYNQSQVNNIFMFSAFNNTDKEIKDFERYLKYYLLDEKIKILDKIISNEVTDKDVFQRRAELLEEYKRERKKIPITVANSGFAIGWQTEKQSSVVLYQQ